MRIILIYTGQALQFRRLLVVHGRVQVARARFDMWLDGDAQQHGLEYVFGRANHARSTAILAVVARAGSPCHEKVLPGKTHKGLRTGLRAFVPLCLVPYVLVLLCLVPFLIFGDACYEGASISTGHHGS